MNSTHWLVHVHKTEPIKYCKAPIHKVEPAPLKFSRYSGTSENGLPIYYEILHNADKRPQSRIIPYSLQYIYMYSNLRVAETSLLRIMDTKVTPQWTKSIQISLWKQTLSTYWLKKYLLFLKTLAVSIHSSTSQGLSALKKCSCMLSFWTLGMWQLERVITLMGVLPT